MIFLVSMCASTTGVVIKVINTRIAINIFIGCLKIVKHLFVYERALAIVISLF